jgi:hypothetical protein
LPPVTRACFGIALNRVKNHYEKDVRNSTVYVPCRFRPRGGGFGFTVKIHIED